MAALRVLIGYIGFCYVLLTADVDEASKKEVKDLLLAYDRTLLVACLLYTSPSPRD